MSQSCEAKRIQYNTVKQAREDYLRCKGTQAVAEAALSDAASDLATAKAEATQLGQMGDFILKQLERETGTEQTLTGLGELASTEADRMREEIDALKSEIRKEKRRFLDAEPSVSPAVAGLYYTQTPDNKVLIGFLAAFGSFLLFLGLALLTGRTPFALLNATTEAERLKMAVGLWVVGIVGMYAAMYMFT